MSEDLLNFFGEHREITSCSAPGRLDVMGGVADYSGSLLLQMPIRERTTVHLARRPDNQIRVRSLTALAANYPPEITILVDANWTNDLLDYNVFRKKFLSKAGGDWAIYVLGCFYLLAKEKSLTFSGADVLVQSDVPFGKGVSSSAAIEVATLMVISQAWKLKLGKLELPILAQRVENLIVGAPCGLMDQLSSFLGEEHKLLPIICQPVQVFPAISIPEQLYFLGLDSGVKHAVSGAAYTNVRVAAFMGYTIIATALGINQAQIAASRTTGNRENLPFSGYLANIAPEEYESEFATLLPATLTGQEFKDQFGTIIDPVTEIVADERYEVRACTAHPIYENYRVQAFKALMQELANVTIADKTGLLEKAGELMYASHQSYSACGLGNAHTDELVSMTQTAGPEAGVYGAKITGGGSGGTVCILAFGTKGLNTVQQIQNAYSQKYQQKIILFNGSSPGGFYS